MEITREFVEACAAYDKMRLSDGLLKTVIIITERESNRRKCLLDDMMALNPKSDIIAPITNIVYFDDKCSWKEYERELLSFLKDSTQQILIANIQDNLGIKDFRYYLNQINFLISPVGEYCRDSIDNRLPYVQLLMSKKPSIDPNMIIQNLIIGNDISAEELNRIILNIHGSFHHNLIKDKRSYDATQKQLNETKELRTIDAVKMYIDNYAHHKVVIIINGKAESGKDTLISKFMNMDELKTRNISSIDPIKKLFKETGLWDGEEKTPPVRKCLHALKMAFEEYNAFVSNWLEEETKRFIASDDEIMFVHIREPKEIEKYSQYLEDIDSLIERMSGNNGNHCVLMNFDLLITSDRTKDKILKNGADDVTEDWDYDFEFENNHSIQTSAELFKDLILQIYDL